MPMLEIPMVVIRSSNGEGDVVEDDPREELIFILLWIKGQIGESMTPFFAMDEDTSIDETYDNIHDVLLIDNA